jgi:manganese transport protein
MEGRRCRVDTENVMISSSQASAIRQPSLEDIHSSVPIPRARWRRFLAFSGPAFLVSVGYMDPGNWGTDIEAGSKYGYRLLWVLLLSNVMAVLLQTLSTRLGVVAGRDLAQACRESYPRPMAILLWLLCEVAIAACDLAEVIGTVIALKLLFGLSYAWGLVIAAGDTFLLLALQRRGVRVLELMTLALIAVIAGSFCIELCLARHDWAEMVRGFIPGFDTTEPARFKDSLYVAIAMLGATVMPHNLYLHSALVQTRAYPHTAEGKRIACRYNFVDSVLALNGAFFVNAAILILSVSTFYLQLGKPVETLQEAHRLLSQVWGTALASGLFAVALLASGQSSTLTGTLAGQVVMEGFVHMRVRPWVRRLLTRLLAILPALVAIGLAGNESWWGAASVDERLLQLLVLSQVVLSFQLPFAIVPLVQFTSDRARMGEFASRGWLKTLAWSCAAVVIGLNAVLIYLQMGKWASPEDGGPTSWWLYGGLGGFAIALAVFLTWVAVYPIWGPREEMRQPSRTPSLAPGLGYRRVGVAVELEGTDDAALAQAGAIAHAHGAVLVPIHVVEGFGAAYHGPQTAGQESERDREQMAELAEFLRRDGLEVAGALGFGKPADELVRIAQERKLDILVMATHGHGFLADLALGDTVAPVLHRLAIPVLVVPGAPGPPKGQPGRGPARG